MRVSLAGKPVLIPLGGEIGAAQSFLLPFSLQDGVILAVIVAQLAAVVGFAVAALVAGEAGAVDVGVDVVVAVSVNPEIGALSQLRQFVRPIGRAGQPFFFVVVPLGNQAAARQEMADDVVFFRRLLQGFFEKGAAFFMQGDHFLRGQRFAIIIIDFAEIRQDFARPAHGVCRFIRQGKVAP